MLVDDLFLFYQTAPNALSTLSLHDALPISHARSAFADVRDNGTRSRQPPRRKSVVSGNSFFGYTLRSEEHTSELQSPMYLVCRLLLEKKKRHTPLGPRGQCLRWSKHRTCPG